MKYLSLLHFCITLVSCSKEQSGDLLIFNTSIINIETGQITPCDILIKDSVITEKSVAHTIPMTATRVVDGSGTYTIPGLWDMHVHSQDSTYFSMFLDHGITGVRDMGGCVFEPTDGCESVCPEILNRWKNAIEEGTLSGPKLFIAGTHLSGTGWPTSFPVTTKKEIEYAFQRNLADKVDFIKVYENISWEAYQEIARWGRLYDLDFVGHVSEPFLLSDIPDLGQRSIEHIREPVFYSFTQDSIELEHFMIADNYSETAREIVKPWIKDAQNVVESFKRNNARLTPTLAVEYARQRYDDSLWINHSLRSQLPKSVTARLHTHIKAMKANKNKNSDILWWIGSTKLVNRFNREKIGMLAGSDAACEGGIPGYSLHEELFLMVEHAGLSPLEALQTATINPCHFFNLQKHGKAEQGHYANLLLLHENPLENIRNTLSIQAVIQNGKIVRQ